LVCREATWYRIYKGRRPPLRRPYFFGTIRPRSRWQIERIILRMTSICLRGPSVPRSLTLTWFAYQSVNLFASATVMARMSLSPIWAISSSMAFSRCFVPPDYPTGKSKKPVQPLLQKYFASPRRANQGHNSARLTQEEGRLAIVTKRAVRCGGREGGARRTQPTRTAKSCGPDAPMLASSRVVAHRSKWIEREIRMATVARKPVTGESAL
jgi:hypothetical protein